MTDKVKGAAEYTQAWPMTHFLIFATDSRQIALPQPADRHVKLIHNGRRPTRIPHAFGTTSKASRTAFSNTLRGSSHARATYIERQYILSELLPLLKTNGQFCSAAEFRQSFARWLSFREESRQPRFGRTTDRAPGVLPRLEGPSMDDDRLFFRASRAPRTTWSAAAAGADAPWSFPRRRREDRARKFTWKAVSRAFVVPQYSAEYNDRAGATRVT